MMKEKVHFGNVCTSTEAGREVSKQVVSNRWFRQTKWKKLPNNESTSDHTRTSVQDAGPPVNRRRSAGSGLARKVLSGDLETPAEPALYQGTKKSSRHKPWAFIIPVCSSLNRFVVHYQGIGFSIPGVITLRWSGAPGVLWMLRFDVYRRWHFMVCSHQPLDPSRYSPSVGTRSQACDWSRSRSWVADWWRSWSGPIRELWSSTEPNGECWLWCVHHGDRFSGTIISACLPTDVLLLFRATYFLSPFRPWSDHLSNIAHHQEISNHIFQDWRAAFTIWYSWIVLSLPWPSFLSRLGPLLFTFTFSKETHQCHSQY